MQGDSIFAKLLEAFSSMSTPEQLLDEGFPACEFEHGYDMNSHSTERDPVSLDFCDQCNRMN